MRELIGFNIICFVVSAFIIMVLAWDLPIKEKIIGMILEVLFVALLSVGVFLMVGA